MIDNYPANSEIIAKRWPAVFEWLAQQDMDSVNAELIEGKGSTLSVNGIQLTSRHDRVREAELQTDSVSNKHRTVYLYGTGLGDMQRVLLQRKKLKELHVRIMNGAVFALVLHLLDNTDWLSDPRVVLDIAGKYPLVQTPYVCLSSELELADGNNIKFRDRLVIEIKRVLANLHFSPKANWLVERLDSNVELMRKDKDVAELFGTMPGGEVFVIATGPTLMNHYEKLKAIRERVDRPLFICVDTAFKPLLDHGIRPDIVVSMDKHIHNGILLHEQSEGIKLVYIPMVKNEVLSLWKGPRYAALEIHEAYDRIRKKVKRSALISNGSVIHPATDLAVRMGAKKITLFGADFAFPGERTHASWEKGALGLANVKANRSVPNGRGEMVKTLFNFCIYLNHMEYYISKHPEVAFFNSCRDGALIQGTHFDEEFAGA
jgi:Uncharacterized protein conserved in bacteria